MIHADEPMRHVVQRTPVDCVIATAAIVANLPFSEAAKASPVRPGTGRILPRGTRALLKATTGTRWWGPRLPWFRKLTYFANLPSVNVMMIRRQMLMSDRFRFGIEYHCIAVQNDVVFDPERQSPLHIEEYDRSDWAVVGYYMPWSKVTLQQTRNLNAKRFSPKERLWAKVLEEFW